MLLIERFQLVADVVAQQFGITLHGQPSACHFDAIQCHIACYKVSIAQLAVAVDKQQVIVLRLLCQEIADSSSPCVVDPSSATIIS